MFGYLFFTFRLFDNQTFRIFQYKFENSKKYENVPYLSPIFS